MRECTAEMLAAVLSNVSVSVHVAGMFGSHDRIAMLAALEARVDGRAAVRLNSRRLCRSSCRRSQASTTNIFGVKVGLRHRLPCCCHCIAGVVHYLQRMSASRIQVQHRGFALRRLCFATYIFSQRQVAIQVARQGRCRDRGCGVAHEARA